MNTRGLVVCGVAVVGLALAPSVVRAQCNTFPPSPPDGRFTTRSIPNATSNVAFFFRAAPERSYSIEANHEVEIGNVVYIFGALNDNCPAVNAAGYRDTAGIDPRFFSNDGARMSLIAPADGYYVMRVDNTSGSTREVRYTVSDTTQFSPSWSTISTFDTFYSFYNTTNSTCAGTLTLINAAGAVADTFAVSIPSLRNTSTNTSAMATPRGATGTARFIHDCPPGGVVTEAAIANFTISPTPYFQFVKFGPVREGSH